MTVNQINRVQAGHPQIEVWVVWYVQKQTWFVLNWTNVIGKHTALWSSCIWPQHSVYLTSVVVVLWSKTTFSIHPTIITAPLSQITCCLVAIKAFCSWSDITEFLPTSTSVSILDAGSCNIMIEFYYKHLIKRRELWFLRDWLACVVQLLIYS